ncbi:MAG TPA: hypothetical protein VNG51_16025 [Ktedonobacteraceae bacterium]|nr:hypothetical protein [Ktedonobacteraceae bacterium]
MMSQRIQQGRTQEFESEGSGKPYNTASIDTSLRTNSSDTDQSRLAGAAGLSVILGQLVAYFSGRANVDDMDVLSFSLHHLFCRIDMLYQVTLPGILDGSLPVEGQEYPSEDCIQDQHVWTQLRVIKHTLVRMEPLCHLLSDATESMLDALDSTNGKSSARMHGTMESSLPDDGQSWLQSLNQERWDLALTAITESLGQWQKSYNHLTPFATQFSHVSEVAASVPNIALCDAALTVVLDSAGAIFGDIVPGFQAIADEDDEAVATLLFDLMQQSDQLLVQFDSIVEPLQALIEHFALGTQAN